MRPHESALYLYLQNKNHLYYGKVLELEQTIEGWLSYVPHSFPHYTRHTIQHSDELIIQASKLIFRNDEPDSGTLSLAPLEAYVLIVSAYLHDAGMVVADQQKLEILGSDAWKEWVSNGGGGAERFREIDKFRREIGGVEEAEGNFIADVQIRFLLAEFVRRTHHLRAGTIIQQHQPALGRFAFDDPVLQRTIADICIAHGLSRYELEDEERYPERRDIKGETVDVRLMAILLRLADLLDMSTDRACPLLLNAACPLPADSLAHWTQYHRIVHRMTAPDEIAITAECETQDEHRVLQDWCQWIVDEVRTAAALMSRSSRHRNWQPPRAELDGIEPTIIIRPARSASYIPSKWTFELDHHAIFERLIHDVYQHPLIFVRELIQNGLDASRCQMYADLQKDGVTSPQYPTGVEEFWRNKYPLHVTLTDTTITSPMSGEKENRQLLTVEDRGVGMDREIIQRYFLQVGRSYYTTDEFRRNFSFVPTSRFGVGFLSVFAVSDRVTIDTYKPLSSSDDGALRLTLTGPRNYLLTEKGHRNTSGTKIEVLLKEPIGVGVLTDLISSWCRRVEFPILVNDLGNEVQITAERPEMFVYEMPDVTEKDGRFVIRVFPINRPGIEGEIYILARVHNKAESWADSAWARYTYPKLHPQAVAPPEIKGLVCVNGISLGPAATFDEGTVSIRVDYRVRADHLDLSRQSIRQRRFSPRQNDPHITSRLEEILSEHLNTSMKAQGPDGWSYKQQLISKIPLSPFWNSAADTIRIFQNCKPRLMSLHAIEMTASLITTVENVGLSSLSQLQRLSINRRTRKDKHWIPRLSADELVLCEEDIDRLSKLHRTIIFQNRFISDVKWVPRHRALVLRWEIGKPQIPTREDIYAPIFFVHLAHGVIGSRIHKTNNEVYHAIVLNTENPVVQWLLRQQQVHQSGSSNLTTDRIKILLGFIDRMLRYGTHDIRELTTYLDQWRELGLASEFTPPPLSLTQTKLFFVQRLR